MPVKPSGDLSMAADIAVEYQDDPDHSLSEFYGDSPSLPLSGEISFSDFYGTRRDSVVTYEMIGAGGGGGYGLSDGYAGSFAGSGFFTSLRFTRAGQDVEIVAPGGQGGGNASGAGSDGGTPGTASVYGPGPAVGAPAVSYGSGGYGGSGDSPSTYDSSGGKGIPGSAGTFVSGTIDVPAGTTVTVIIGTGGRGGQNGGRSGGDGANGYGRFSFDGFVYEFTVNGSFIIPG